MPVGAVTSPSLAQFPVQAVRPVAPRQQQPEQSSQTNQAALQQSQTQLQTQIAQQVGAANPGADVNVQYRYTTGPDGQLVVSGATVTVSESQPLPLRLGGSGEAASNRLAGINDVVDVRSNQRANQVQAESSEDSNGLTDAEREQVRRLQAIDTSIRQHEGLHFRASGGLGSIPEYQTVTGPDGKQYAVAGSVAVSGTRGAGPEQAAREAQTLVAAATAPADASAQDISAARQFAQNGAAAFSQANEVRQETISDADDQRGEIFDLFA